MLKSRCRTLILDAKIWNLDHIKELADAVEVASTFPRLERLEVSMDPRDVAVELGVSTCWAKCLVHRFPALKEVRKEHSRLSSKLRDVRKEYRECKCRHHLQKSMMANLEMSKLYEQNSLLKSVVEERTEERKEALCTCNYA